MKSSVPSVRRCCDSSCRGGVSDSPINFVTLPTLGAVSNAVTVSGQSGNSGLCGRLIAVGLSHTLSGWRFRKRPLCASLGGRG
jgi:hypothetical protein